MGKSPVLVVAESQDSSSCVILVNIREQLAFMISTFPIPFVICERLARGSKGLDPTHTARTGPRDPGVHGQVTKRRKPVSFSFPRCQPGLQHSEQRVHNALMEKVKMLSENQVLRGLAFRSESF